MRTVHMWVKSCISCSSTGQGLVHVCYICPFLFSLSFTHSHTHTHSDLISPPLFSSGSPRCPRHWPKELCLPWTWLPETAAACAWGSPSWGRLCPGAPEPEMDRYHWPHLRYRIPFGREHLHDPFVGWRDTPEGSPACTCCQGNRSMSGSGKGATQACRSHQN